MATSRRSGRRSGPSSASTASTSSTWPGSPAGAPRSTSGRSSRALPGPSRPSGSSGSGRRSAAIPRERARRTSTGSGSTAAATERPSRGSAATSRTTAWRRSAPPGRIRAASSSSTGSRSAGSRTAPRTSGRRARPSGPRWARTRRRSATSTTSDAWAPSSRSTSSRRLPPEVRRQPGRAGPAGEDAAGERLALERLGREAPARARDHEDVERLAGEDAARRLAHRDRDDPVELARGRVAAHLARAPDRRPEAAVGVDADAVDEAGRGGRAELDHAPALAELAAREVEVVGVDAARERVDVVEAPTVRRPVEPVRERDAVEDAPDGPVGLEAVEGAGALGREAVLVHADRPRPEAPERVAPAVVHEPVGGLLVDVRDERVPAVGVEPGEALVGRESEAAAPGRDGRADAPPDVDARRGDAVRPEPVDPALVDLDPAQRAPVGVPDRPLAEVDARVEEDVYQLSLI